MVGGVTVGLFIGAMPGLGSVNGIAILLPMTFLVPPTSAMIFLAVEPFMDSTAGKMFLLVGGGVTVMIGLVHVIGMYGAIPVFMIYYLRVLGQHSWPLTLAISVSTPIFVFFFFDVAMRIVLPKAYLEPLFLPLYDIFL